MAKVVLVLHEDIVGDDPEFYARDDAPAVDLARAQNLPAPRPTDFKPGALARQRHRELGLRRYLAAHGHTLVVTSSKDHPSAAPESELNAEVVISQPPLSDRRTHRENLKAWAQASPLRSGIDMRALANAGASEGAVRQG